MSYAAASYWLRNEASDSVRAAFYADIKREKAASGFGTYLDPAVKAWWPGDLIEDKRSAAQCAAWGDPDDAFLDTPRGEAAADAAASAATAEQERQIAVLMTLGYKGEGA